MLRARSLRGADSVPPGAHFKTGRHAGVTFMLRTEDKRARLLVVDDDPQVRGILCNYLGGAYTCAAAASAEEALALLGGCAFDLVLSDILMEGISGLELLRHVRAHNPDLPVIMISGVQTTENPIAAMRAGAYDYIMKPFDLEQVELAVARALERRELVEARRRHESRLEELVAQRTAELEGAYRSLEEVYRVTLKALTAALEARDDETHGHSERVVGYSLRLGRELGLEAGQLRSLEFGALLHDIGKVGVPDAVLRKPGRLTEEEWREMRHHPEHGRRILQGISFLEGAARVVAEHHERWDGSGYPAGLRGEGIDLNARIFAVADAFDAMTSDRVYRKARPYEAAAAEIEEWACRQFDPTVVAAFLRVPAGEWEQIRRRSLSEIDSPEVTDLAGSLPPRAALTAPAAA